MARFYSSSDLNTMSYIVRSERIIRETPYKIDEHIWDFRRPYKAEFDKLQMALMNDADYSCEPEDCLSGAMGHLISAENTEEYAEELAEKADIERRKAKLFREFAGEDARFFQLADEADEIAEDCEEEADRLYAFASEKRSWWEYYEAEYRQMLRVRNQISGWYSIFSK